MTEVSSPYRKLIQSNLKMHFPIFFNSKKPKVLSLQFTNNKKPKISFNSLLNHYSDSKQIRAVRRLIINENYSESNHDSDIAIMILVSPFSHNKYVRPACLPEPDFEPRGGAKCIISGWGKTEKGELEENVLIYFQKYFRKS